MRSANDSLDKKVLSILPSLFTQKTAEDFMVALVAFIETLVAVIEIHAHGGIQTRLVRESEQEGGPIWDGLRHILKRGREAKKATKKTGIFERNMEAIQGPERGPTENTGCRLGNRSIMSVHVRHEFLCNKLSISGTAQLWGKIKVSKGGVVVRKTFRVANAYNDGFWQDATSGERLDPLVGSPVHTGNGTRGGIEDIVAIVEDEKREAMLGIAAIAGRKPNQQITGTR
jgi:hypothetical protein